MDRIVIRELSIRCIVGVLPAERVTPQEVLVSLDVGTDTAPACPVPASCGTPLITRRWRSRHGRWWWRGRYRLLETMAEDLAQCVLQSELAAEVRVTIRKPAAIAGAADAGVEIVRAR